ncbi:Porphobilinogen deaminase [bacterium HR12]|nr:Porphobilinogen deaminase [bacterium HR12]
MVLADRRGNVDTRLRKLREGEVDAIVLAAAGLVRLGIVPEHAAPMSTAEMLPAPGQGILGVQARADDEATLAALAPLEHPPSRLALLAERAIMRRLGGGCALPLGAYAEAVDGRVRLTAAVFTPDGAREARASAEAADPEEVAAAVEADLRAAGAEEILRTVRS